MSRKLIFPIHHSNLHHMTRETKSQYWALMRSLTT